MPGIIWDIRKSICGNDDAAGSSLGNTKESPSFAAPPEEMAISECPAGAYGFVWLPAGHGKRQIEYQDWKLNDQGCSGNSRPAPARNCALEFCGIRGARCVSRLQLPGNSYTDLRVDRTFRARSRGRNRHRLQGDVPLGGSGKSGG